MTASNPIPITESTAEEDSEILQKFKAPDGSFDSNLANAWLQQTQAATKEGPLPAATLRDAITVIRALRRTNTGPPRATKKKAAPQKIEGTPDLLDL